MIKNASDATARISETVPADGFYYRGRPAWMTDKLIGDLREEAVALRPGALLLRRQFHTIAGPHGQDVASSANMLELIEEHATQVIPGGPCNYLYYEREGDGIDPHIDTKLFDLNVLMLLEHTWESRPSSRLVLFPHGPDKAVQIRLAPGEFVLFRSTGVVHTRTNVAAGEVVCNLGIGYCPLRALPPAAYWRP